MQQLKFRQIQRQENKNSKASLAARHFLG